jgi:hypothetical protein
VLTARTFADERHEAEWVAGQVAGDIKNRGLQPTDLVGPDRQDVEKLHANL